MNRRFVAVLALGVVVGGVVPAARGALFMRLNGVTGDATADGYQGAIEIDSFGLSASRDVTSPTGGSGKREVSPPSFSDLSVTARASSASVAILKGLLDGSPFDPLNLYVVRADRDRLETVAEWDFRDAIVTSFQTSSGGDLPEDAYAFNFDKFTYTWHNLDQNGKEIGHVQVQYDLLAGKTTALDSVGDVSGFEFVTGVPEPGAAGVLTLVGGAVIGRRRRRRGA